MGVVKYLFDANSQHIEALDQALNVKEIIGLAAHNDHLVFRYSRELSIIPINGTCLR